MEAIRHRTVDAGKVHRVKWLIKRPRIQAYSSGTGRMALIPATIYASSICTGRIVRKGDQDFQKIKEKESLIFKFFDYHSYHRVQSYRRAFAQQ